ncbi:tripartite tricarboxylate transporter substrate binding protein [Candidimonas humi]|uniref:Bug family tripartite tricarboxylate transporter substrate binding protein n=1 Tax=Candidimonas humi TaxID=683355 RepID=A0ABV8P0W0_9BURK|nr:tripartite tricarboxylate transporter substrate binding protein [Candidimonas humi]MBV6305492.1 tripartite tricarboxylate transporter substrate binding protein [Candidimonas humi]
MQRRQILGHVLAALMALPMAAMAAQSYPDRPVTIVVPFAVGGGSDNIARLIATKLATRTGKTFIIDNRGGGGTNIGNSVAARATPDGYTLLLGQFTLSVNPYLYRHLPYKPDTFVPVVHIANAPTVLIVPKTSPIKDVQGLISAAKAAPGKLNFGSGGFGTSVQLAGELFKLKTGTQMVHIPYKGSAPAMKDLIGGEINMMFDTATSALSYVKNGQVRAIGIAAQQRMSTLPDVPTFAEQGLKDFDVPVWYGFVAPAGTPAAAVQWLNTQVDAVLKDDAVVKQLSSLGAVPVGGTSAQFGDFMKAQAARWEHVIKAAGIKPN